MDRKIKVLMVDDEAQFRATTEKILTRRGFVTIMAADGEEALGKIDQDPQVVVLDIKMPGMSGLETLAELKKRKPDLPVIMLTGHGSEPSAREALEQGAYDYLTKPCEIDILASKIMEAVRHGTSPGEAQERLVEEVMIPLEEYTTIQATATVGQAIDLLRRSFESKAATSRLMETGHRSLLVLDQAGGMSGILTIADLLGAIMPAYLSAPKPSLADTIQYSPLFWKGMFTREVKALAKLKLVELMSPPPPRIEAQATLMEAAYSLVTIPARRLAVVREGQVVGVIREQDLFFEMERLMD